LRSVLYFSSPVSLLLCFFFSRSFAPPYLHSFPTRRSSDLLLRFAIAHPTYLRQFDAPVPVVYLEALRDSETLALTFLLELRELRALLKEVAVGALQVL